MIPPRWGTPRSKRKTLGPALAKVSDAFGLPLFEWQQHVADVALEHQGGRFTYRTVGVSVGRQNGKTALAAARIGLELLQPGHVCAFTAQDRNMARGKWEEHVERIMDSSLAKRVSRVARSNGNEALYMKNGSSYRVVTPNRKGARGLTIDLVVIDEALTHSMEVIAALQPTMATKPNAQLWILSNAGDSNSTMLAHYRNLGHEKTTKSLSWHEWSPGEDKFDPLDPEVWAQAIPTLDEAGGVTLDAVADAAATTEPELFAREWLNVWPALEAVAVIAMGDWEKLEKPDVAIGFDTVLGLDVSPQRDCATIAACGRNGAFTPVEVVDHRQHVGWVEERLVELYKKWRAPVVIDGGSPAGSFIVTLEQAGVEVIALGMRDYARACGSFYDGVVEGTVTHLGDRLLTDAVGAASKRRLAEQWAWNRRSTVNITPLVAATLARWGVVSAHQKKPTPAIH